MTNRLVYWLVRTDANLGALVARVALGICMLPHGIQKLQNFSGTMDGFTKHAGVPAPFAFLVILAESFGALGLILGVFGRFCAFGIGLVMTGAILMVHGKMGFFIKAPPAVKPGETVIGYEYNLALLGLAVAVVIMGSGSFSFDRWLTKRAQQAPV
jgi:putative oxidoreductase